MDDEPGWNRVTTIRRDVWISTLMPTGNHYSPQGERADINLS